MPANQRDPFDNSADSPSHPAREAFTIIPHDVEALPRLPKAILVGAAGSLALRAVNSSADVQIPVFAGQLIPIRASHVRASGTTAAMLVGLA